MNNRICINDSIRTRLSDRHYEADITSYSVPASCVEVVTEPVWAAYDHIELGWHPEKLRLSNEKSYRSGFSSLRHYQVACRAAHDQDGDIRRACRTWPGCNGWTITLLVVQFCRFGCREQGRIESSLCSIHLPCLTLVASDWLGLLCLFRPQVWAFFWAYFISYFQHLEIKLIKW